MPEAAVIDVNRWWCFFNDSVNDGRDFPPSFTAIETFTVDATVCMFRESDSIASGFMGCRLTMRSGKELGFALLIPSDVKITDLRFGYGLAFSGGCLVFRCDLGDHRVDVL